MTAIETPLAIAAASGTLIGIATRTARVCDVAVLILPAPGETRTGPDRLHVRLARELGRAGLPSLRFDPSDGGDCLPSMGNAARFDEDALAAARRLLVLHPDAWVAVLAVGRGAAGAVRAWHALAGAALPLSALCLVDPVIRIGGSAVRPGWWRRLLGARTIVEAEPATGSIDVGGSGGEPGEGEPGDGPLWLGLPDAVRAARSKLLVVARGDDRSNAALVELAYGDRAWRKALRRSDGWLQLRDADAGFTEAVGWRALNEWLVARLGG